MTKIIQENINWSQVPGNCCSPTLLNRILKASIESILPEHEKNDVYIAHILYVPTVKLVLAVTST